MSDDHLHVLGRTLGWDGLPARLVHGLRARWDFPEHRVAAQDAPYRIQVRGRAPDWADGGWAAALPAAAPREVAGMSETFELRPQPGGFGYSGPHGQLTCRHRPGGTDIRLASPGNGEAGDVLEDVLHVAVVEALRHSGLMPLHVAAVMSAGDGGTATVFAGPSGRGKSTTLLQAMRAGAVPVAEDLVWYDPASTLIYGWERAVRLLPGSLHLLPQSARQGDWPLTPDGKRNVPYTALSSTSGPGGVQRGGVPLRRFVALERRPDEDTRLEPLSRRDAVLIVWEATGLPLGDDTRSMVPAQMERMMRHTSFARLRLGHGSLHQLLPLDFGPLDAPSPGAARP